MGKPALLLMLSLSTLLLLCTSQEMDSSDPPEHWLLSKLRSKLRVVMRPLFDKYEKAFFCPDDDLKCKAAAEECRDQCTRTEPVFTLVVLYSNETPKCTIRFAAPSARPRCRSRRRWSPCSC